MRNLKLVKESRYKPPKGKNKYTVPTADMITVLREDHRWIFHVDPMDALDIDIHSEEGSFKAIKLSPDFQLVATVNEHFQLILYNYCQDVINKVDLKDDTFGEGEFITVGWGKKETQFHGSEGKQAAKTNVSVQEDETIQNDDVIITWRGDAEFFAVGYKLTTTSRFKVFNREGVLKFTSEKLPGLEPNFSWKQTGNLIATTQVLPNKYVVAFFEKNGLKHGEFELPFKNTEYKVKQLSWSGDSEILCVWCVSVAQPQYSSLLLYTVNNYHWYLKQSLRFKDDLSSIMWIQCVEVEREKNLFCVLNDGTLLTYNWVFNVDGSKGKTENDEAIVAVIDGEKLNLTFFRKGVVPPPMCDTSITSNSYINSVIFGPQNNSNDLIILTDEANIELFKCNNRTMQSCGVSSLIIEDDEYPFSTPIMNNQICWTKDDILYILLPHSKSTTVCKVIKLFDGTTFTTRLIKNHIIDAKVIGITDSPDSNEALLQTHKGAILKASQIEITSAGVSFPEYSHKFEALKIDNETFLFGLTYQDRFFIGNCEVANDVNSYIVHSDFLLLTTLQHTLKCVKLDRGNIKKLQENKGFFLIDGTKTYNRKLERGSRLICSVPGDTRTILQLPRGNLECIQPRPLSLKSIGNYLDKCQYNEAFDLMRKQRINLNLIYDHDTTKFLQNISTFVKCIDNPSWINLFIFELNHQDVTVTMYSSSYHRNANESNLTKVKDVCEALRKEFEIQNENDKLLLPLLTIDVKLNDLKTALSRIKTIKAKNANSLADEALRHLTYLMNVHKIYDVALSMYDFDLVMYVASKTQRDPKEYVPYLNELKNMEENYRHFTIDNDLRDYESALKNLIKCGPEKEEELLNYVKKHNKHTLALQHLEPSDSRYTRCAEEYATYLHARRFYYEAGVLFKRSGNYEKALESFLEALDWRSALNVAKEINISSDDLRKIQMKLSNSLKEIKKYDDALAVLQYKDNVNFDELFACAMEGKLFKEAINLSYQYGKTTSIDGLVKAAVKEQYEFYLSHINQNKEQFIQHKNRLAVVRKKKSEGANQKDDYMPDCDLYSDTSSIIGSTDSRSSGRSFRSSKNRRKHERKLVSLKEGSRFEDVALIRAIHVLVTSTFSLRREVYTLNTTMQWLGMDKCVSELQNLLDDVTEIMKNSFREIWTTDLVTEAYKGDSGENVLSGDATDASHTLEPHLRTPPVVQDIKWKSELIS